jgi:hypothetical protein
MIRSQNLDYLGVPFRCTVCRKTGHLRWNFPGYFSSESPSSESSLMQEPASTDPPEVSLSAWIARPQGSDSDEPIENNLTDKLRSFFPSLYFSLTSWEQTTLDNLPGWNNLLMQENPQHIKQASTFRETSWTAPVHILKYFGSCCAAL